MPKFFVFVPPVMSPRRRPGETKRALFSQVLSNCDVVECILASFGSTASKAGRVSRLWLEAAQQVLARCRVVELEASIGTYWSTDEVYFDEDGVMRAMPERDVQDFGLEVTCAAGFMVATPTGLLVSDSNNHRVLVLDPTGQPERSIEWTGYPGSVAFGFDSIFAESYDFGNPSRIQRRSFSGEDVGFPSSPARVFFIRIVGESLFVVGESIPPLVGVVHEYEAETASFVRVFCTESKIVMSMADVGETLLMLVPGQHDDERYVSTYSLVTGELWTRCVVPDNTIAIEAQNDRLFAATARLRHERGALHIMLLDGTPLQELEVYATGGPLDLCVAHGKLYCLCNVDDSEENCIKWNETVEDEYTPLGGDEEMRALCVYSPVGASQHF